MTRLWGASLTMFVLFAFAGSTQVLGVQNAGQTKTTEQTIPEDRAKAIFEDARVKTFMKVAQSDFGGMCAAPSYKNLKARVTVPAVIPPGVPPDAVSVYYEVKAPCSGKVAGVTIRAEFAGPAGPLNLTLSLDLKQ